MPSATSPAGHSVASTRRLLNIVLAVGLIDLVLFLILIWVAFIDRNESIISIVGPIHGIGFVALVLLTANGAVQGRWGWWFPAVTLVTSGPPGSIVGDFILRKQLDAQVAAGSTDGDVHGRGSSAA